MNMKQKRNSTPRAIVLSGLGLNCEQETAAAWRDVGVAADIVHLHDVLERPACIRAYDILTVPGGFSYGDDTGSGKAYGTRLREVVGPELERFLSRDTLALGICNGFQILTHARLLPGALVHNDSRRYICRWVDVRASGASPWLQGIDTLSLPIAHGEGKYVHTEEGMKEVLQLSGEGMLTYVPGAMSTLHNLPYNPNGAMHDIAGLTSHKGRVLGLMPHPERGFFFTHRPDWTRERDIYASAGKKMPRFADGYRLFENAARFFT
jgi:phosphoribosylformylglycinamidine synthase subunit PurQ / glutaminase